MNGSLHNSPGGTCKSTSGNSAVTVPPGGKVVTCPEVPIARIATLVFVGGGITGCPDWQTDFCRMVREAVSAADGDKSFALLNPRRENFPINDLNASNEQIRWEWNLLREAGAVSMWFPKETEGPISLFELGRWLCSPKPIYVGIENGYKREVELRASVEALRPGLPISTTLEQHATVVADWVLGSGYNRAFATPFRECSPGRVYLAGGIKHCPDWQSELVRLLSDIPGIYPHNPRVDGFVPQSPDDYVQMVRENRQNLERCNAVIFWFPKDMLTPVALCELGAEIARERPIFIGVEPGYKRAIDVEVQAHLERPDISIAMSLNELARQVRNYYGSLERASLS